METRYSRTLVLLPRLSPIGKIVHLIGDKFKPFFLDKLGNSQISEVIKGKQYQLIRNCNFIYRTFGLVNHHLIHQTERK